MRCGRNEGPGAARVWLASSARTPGARRSPTDGQAIPLSRSGLPLSQPFPPPSPAPDDLQGTVHLEPQARDAEGREEPAVAGGQDAGGHQHQPARELQRAVRSHVALNLHGHIGMHVPRV